MMKALLQPYLIQLVTSRLVRRCLYKLIEVKLRMQGSPIYYYHQVDDPYSYLLSQCLAVIPKRYNIQLHCVLVGNPPDWALPDRNRFIDYTIKDAKDIAPFYQLKFSNKAKPPRQELVDKANQLLAHPDNLEYFLLLSQKLGRALFVDDELSINQLIDEYPSCELDQTQALLAANQKLRDQKGHYLSGVLYYEPDWYWGLDRLPYLEARLNRSGMLKPKTRPEPIAVRKIKNTPIKVKKTGLPQLEVYFSMRSPYSYLALVEVSKLLDKYPLTWSAKPVLPMVMRGLEVPNKKRLYIVRDVKREAERLNIPFGKICDPLGEGVLRGLALIPFARKQGKLLEFLLSFMQGVFAEGIDSASEHGLNKIISRVGLDTSKAKPFLDDDSWQQELEANRQDLLDLGLWGVPCFRFGEFSTWGRDRLWLIEEKIKIALEE